jgi:hypothetical protein
MEFAMLPIGSIHAFSIFEKVRQMFSLFQLLLAVFGIYGALHYSDEAKLLVPLVCLFFMFLVGRLEKAMAEKKTDRDSLQKLEIDRAKAKHKELAGLKDQDFLTIESLLWPKNELLLIDAVQFILRDLGFKVSTGINYHSVDRILKIPNTEKAFGLEILMSEGEAENNHPKLRRALEFEKEKKEHEKTLIVASTHTHLSLSERGHAKDASEGLVHFLTSHRLSLISAYSLYELWKKTKGGENDVTEVFEKLHSHPGGIFDLKEAADSPPLPFQLPLQ